MRLKLQALPLIGAGLLFLAACELDDQAGTAAGTGMLAGMTAGAVIGAFNGDFIESAVVGGMAGAAGNFVADQASR